MTNTYIIIVTYNGMPWLDKCLSSCGDYPVILIDNASTDGTLAFVQEKYPKVQVVAQKANLGFGQANNLGIQLALKQGADFVFLLNQDVYVQTNCIENLVGVYGKHSTYGILSPMHFDGKGETLDEKFMLYLKRYKLAETLLFNMCTNKTVEVYPIEFVNAAAWLISRDCIEKVGGFDPLFFHYGEDRNYCQRVNYHQYKIGIVPSASIFHDREDRKERNIEKYSEAYYREFLRYLKVDWADINLEDFEAKYDARSRYLSSKQRRALLKFQFKEAKDYSVKRKLMLESKAAILQSRQQSRDNVMPYL